MEDALAHQFVDYKEHSYLSLNPCFNGRCTRTGGNKRSIKEAPWVLILVLMEDALALECINI